MDEYEKLDEELKKVYEVRLQESERDTYFIEAWTMCVCDNLRGLLLIYHLAQLWIYINLTIFIAN